MEFWTTLIRVSETKGPAALLLLEECCRHVEGPYWIMEGEVDVLRDAGVVLEEVAEGAIEGTGDLNPEQVRQLCRDAYGVDVEA